MATDLTDLVGGGPAPADEPQVWRGRVIRTPVNERDSLRVTIPALAGLQAFEVPPAQWMARGNALPQAGASCLVLLDESGDAHVPSYEGPNAYATEGGGGGGGASYSTAVHAAGTTIIILAAEHGLGAKMGLLVQVQNATTGVVELPDITVSSAGTVTVTFATAVVANAKRVTVVG